MAYNNFNFFKNILTWSVCFLALGFLAALPVNAQENTDTIVLGTAVALTGKYASSGKDTLEGYQLAIQKINEKGGVKVEGKTYKFELKYYDDESSTTRSEVLAERLIN